MRSLNPKPQHLAVEVIRDFIKVQNKSTRQNNRLFCGQFNIIQEISLLDVLKTSETRLFIDNYVSKFNRLDYYKSKANYKNNKKVRV